jgi:hypothetical protein
MQKMWRAFLSGLAVCAVFACMARVARAQGAMGAPPFTRQIYMTPIPGAPFSAVVEQEMTTVLQDGNSFQRKSVAEIARDSRGRIHNETRQNLPLTATGKPVLISMMTYDPDRRMSTFMNPYTHIARQLTFAHAESTAPPDDWAQHTQPASTTYPEQFHFEDLGTSVMEGVDVHGYRRTVTLPQQISATEQPVVVTDEYWYSEELHINMLQKHSDPRTGELTVRVTKLERIEPPSALFEVPPEYKVVDITPPGRAAQ